MCIIEVEKNTRAPIGALFYLEITWEVIFVHTVERVNWLSLKDTARILGWTIHRTRKLWSLPGFPGFKCGGRYVVEEEAFLHWFRGEYKRQV